MGALHERIEAEGRGALASARSKRERKALQIAMSFMADESVDLGFVHPSMGTVKLGRDRLRADGEPTTGTA